MTRSVVIHAWRPPSFETGLRAASIHTTREFERSRGRNRDVTHTPCESGRFGEEAAT